MIGECFIYWIEPVPLEEDNIPLRALASPQGQPLLYRISIFLFSDFILALASPHSSQTK